jgi:hypothetical protein
VILLPPFLVLQVCATKPCSSQILKLGMFRV